MISPWKACDIRGPYPTPVSLQLMRSVGICVASLLPVHSRVLIAGDFRTSTPVLKSALAEGLLGAGAHVLDAGQIATPVAYFAKQRWNADAVLIVTASHNPATHNGLKLMIGNLPPTPSELEQIRRCSENPQFRQAQGILETIDPVPPYRDWIVQRWEELKSATLRDVVLDAGNGAWSELAPRIFESLGFRVHRLFCQIDGSFPHRSPDCARSSALGALRKEVRRTHAPLGIAWDGDGDRVAFVDETGTIVSTDAVAALVVRHMLSTQPNAKVVHDIKLSGIVRQAVMAAGGTPIMERSGHTFIKRRMLADRCLFGCEASGHYFFSELDGGDDGLFAALLMCELVSQAGSLERLRKSLPPIFATPDLRLPATTLAYGDAIQRLQALFKGARETTIDGLRLETPDGFVLARESVTEPVVTVRLEGFSAEGLRRLLEACLRILPEFSVEIQRQIHQSEQS